MATAGPVFITGASGFIGGHLLARALERGVQVRCLSRRKGHSEGRLTWVRGRLEARDTYEHALEGCEAVVHMGAQTGKARAADFKRSNVDGTRALLSACRAAKVQRILYVSTIATRYPEIQRYPYAQSKQQAEALVMESGLSWTIMRPTIVLGPGSPILSSLSGLAKLPVMPIFGRGQIQVQPIMVDDIALSLMRWLDDGAELAGAQIDLGGPEQLSFEAFMQRLRKAQGKRSGRVVGLPLKSTMWGLGLVDPALGPLLPVTAGQLYAFRYDSTAQPSKFLEEMQAGFMGLDEALSRSFEDAAQSQAREKLEAECVLLTRYLIDQDPSELVKRAYVRAHEVGSLERPKGDDGYDRALMALAMRGGAFTRASDVHARFFAHTGLLRRKLVLLLAILETDAQGRARADVPSPGGAPAAYVRLVASGLSSAGLLLAGLPVLLPARALLRRSK